MTRLLHRIWLPVLLVGVWEAGSRFAEDPFFPPPSQIAGAAYDMWFSGAAPWFVTRLAWDDWRPSVIHLLAGWVLAALIGIAGGVLVGLSQRAGAAIAPLLHFFRSIPPPALLPFFVAVFSIDGSMQIATIAFGIVWPIWLNTIDGVRGIDPLQRDVAGVFHFSGVLTIGRVILPAAAPKIMAGLRISIGYALVLMVLSELVGSTTGIGARLLSAQRAFEFPQQWAGIALLGVLGYALNGIFILVERRTLAWHHHTRESAEP